MKRSPLRRSTKPLARHTPLKAKPGQAAKWQRARRQCRDRASGVCEVWLLAQAGYPVPTCDQQGCHAHHILMRSHGGNNNVDNLLWCCSTAHRWIHEHPALSYELGLLQRGAAA